MSSFTQQQIEWARQVRLDIKVSDKAVRIADALAFDYMNAKTLDAWPAMATICARVDASERAVRRALDQLVERGHLTIKSGGGRNKSNRYGWIIQPENTGKNAGVLDGETLAYAKEFTTDEAAKPRQKRHVNSGSFGAKTLANMPEEPSEENRLKEPDGGSALGRASASTDHGCSLVIEEHHLMEADAETECGSGAHEAPLAAPDPSDPDASRSDTAIVSDLWLNDDLCVERESAALSNDPAWRDVFDHADEALEMIWCDADLDFRRHAVDAVRGLADGMAVSAQQFRHDLARLLDGAHPTRRRALFEDHLAVMETVLADFCGGRRNARKVIARFTDENGTMVKGVNHG